MIRTNLFFKVEVEHDRDESPERLGRRDLPPDPEVLRRARSRPDEFHESGRVAAAASEHLLVGAAEEAVGHAGDVVADHAMGGLVRGLLRVGLAAGGRGRSRKNWNSSPIMAHRAAAVVAQGVGERRPARCRKRFSSRLVSAASGVNAARRCGKARTSSTSRRAACLARPRRCPRSDPRPARRSAGAGLRESARGRWRRGTASPWPRRSRDTAGTHSAMSSAAIRPADKRVVQVGRVVGHLVGQIDQLRFERRAQAGQVRRPAPGLRRARNRASV